jgi:inosine-uridine nucleoside N-ribohydrolase
MLRIFILVLLSILFSCVGRENNISTTAKIILDTDFGNDCDDTGALAILHQMANNGEAEILATMYPMNDSMGAAAIDVVNTYYGRPDIPVGTYKGSYTYKEKHNDFYNSALAKAFRHDLKSGNDAQDAVLLYRQILSKQPDSSVTIVVVGPQRLVADLLLSKGDSISPLDGKSLVAKKVKHLVSMGTGVPSGDEWNIKLCPDGAQLVAREWPTKIVYAPFEIGEAIMTGQRLITETQNNPVKMAFETNPMVDSVKNRHSWDQTAVLFAVRSDSNYWAVENALLNIDDAGKNVWEKSKSSRAYLTVKRSPLEIKKIIEDMMVEPPVK